MCVQSLDAEQLNSNQENYFQYQSEVTISSLKKVCLQTGIWRSPSLHETSVSSVH